MTVMLIISQTSITKNISQSCKDIFSKTEKNLKTNLRMLAFKTPELLSMIKHTVRLQLIY